MGLDVVELVMEIEDEFGIQITNENYPKLVTVGDLRDLVVVKLAMKEGWEPVGLSSFCPSAALFFWLRKGLSTALAQSHGCVRLTGWTGICPPSEDGKTGPDGRQPASSPCRPCSIVPGWKPCRWQGRSSRYWCRLLAASCYRCLKTAMRD